MAQPTRRMVAELVPEASVPQLFKTYCSLCPFKLCWAEKSMGATGDIIVAASAG